MKKTLYILIIILASLNICKSDFNKYFDIEMLSTDYMDICIAEENKVYICGLYGSVYSSNDRGKTWTIGKSNCDALLLSISGIADKAITVGTDGAIRFTSDGGRTWENPQSSTTQTLKCIVMIDLNTGIAVGNSGTIIKTSDGGQTWIQINSEISSDILSALVTNSKTIFISTVDGNIYKSIDNGENWIIQNIPVKFANPRKFSYSSDNVIYLLTENALLKSTDDGLTWQYFNNPYTKSEFCSFKEEGRGFIGGSFLNSRILKIENDTTIIDTVNIADYYDEVFPTAIKRIAFFDDNNCIAIGINNLIATSSDGGELWNFVSYFNTYPPQGRISSINFVNDSLGFIGTVRETIYKTINKGITWHYIKKDSLRNTKSSINDLFFFDENVGMMKSNDYYGTLLSTNDGGLTIRRDTASKAINGADFGFDYLNDSTFLIVGWRWFYNTWHTYFGFREFDGTWNNKGVFDSCQFRSKYIFNKDKIFLAGSLIDSSQLPDGPHIFYRGMVVKTDDAGKTWEKTIFDTLEIIRGFQFDNENLGYLFGNTYYSGPEDSVLIFKTTDCGVNWSLIDTNLVRKAATLRGVNSNYSIGYGKNKKFLFTSDYGANWSEVPFPSVFVIQKFFGTDNCFYVTGMWGSFNILLRLKLKDEFVPVDEEINVLPAPLAYMSIPYPNPANEFTNFDIVWDKRYDLNELNFSICDIYGKKIHMPLFEIYTQSINRAIIRWNTSGIPQGLYIFQLEVNGYRRIQKVIVY